MLRRPAVAAALSLGLIAFADRAFDLQVVGDLDHAQFLRLPDRQHRHRRVPAGHVSRSCASSLSAGVAIAVPLLVLIWRIDPFRVRRAHAAAAGGGVPGGHRRRFRSRVPEQPAESFQGVNHVSNFSRSGVLAVSELMTKGWIELDATPDRLRIGRRRAVPDRRQAAAHHPGARRSELRHHRGAGHQGAARLCQPFSIVRRQGAQVRGRRLRRPDLVHRIQRADRAVGAVLRRPEVLRHAHRRRSGRARPAAGAAPLRLPDLQPLSGLWRVSRARAASRPPPGIERFIDLQDMRAEYVEPDRFYYDQALRVLQRRDANDKPKFIFVYTVANHFPWHERYRPERHAGVARSRQRVRGRRIHPAADHERARLPGVRRASQDAISRTSRSWWCGSAIISRRFPGRSSSRRSTMPKSDGAWRRTIRATSRPTTRSTRSTSRRPICRRRSTGWRRRICRW